MDISTIAVISAGSFGTALARVLSLNGHKLRLHVREIDTYQVIKACRVNSTYLPDVPLDLGRIHVTMELPDALRGVEYVILAVPSQHVRYMMRQLREFLEPEATIILTSKGLVDDGVTMSEIALRELPDITVCGLYGITFARFIALGQGLSSMCVASPIKSAADRVAGLFAGKTSESFRIYVTDDLRGAEFGGAMKNVYAATIAIVDRYLEAQCRLSKEFSEIEVTRYAFVQSCIMEFIEFGLAHGARIYTLLGPSGIGDIQASAGGLSRNYMYGSWRASLDLVDNPDAAPPLHEGYETVEAAMTLSRRYNIATPILRATYDILFESKTVQEIIPAILQDLSMTVQNDREELFIKLVEGQAAVQPSLKKIHPPGMRKIAFVSYRFSTDSEKYMKTISAICSLHGIEVITGTSEGLVPSDTTVSDIVKNKIKRADFYIAVFMRDAGDSGWLVQERACASAYNKPMMIFVFLGMGFSSF